LEKGGAGQRGGADSRVSKIKNGRRSRTKINNKGDSGDEEAIEGARAHADGSSRVGIGRGWRSEVR
jgi:hypothetical protein